MKVVELLDSVSPYDAAMDYRTLTGDDLMYENGKWYVSYPEESDRTKLANWYPNTEENILRDIAHVLTVEYRRAAKVCKQYGLTDEYENVVQMQKNVGKVDFLKDAIAFLKIGRGKGYFGIRD